MSRPGVPKLCGADVELANFILGARGRGGTGAQAAWALLQQIDGLPLSDWSRALGRALQERDSDAPLPPRRTGTRRRVGFDPQDWGRRFLPGNGGCFYIDLDHLELCLPETLSAFDHLACWHAMLRLARAAMNAADAELPAGQRLQVLVNNSDGRGHSYGSHLSFLIGRRAWSDLLHRRLHLMLYLASYQVSSILFGGQGKVGSENDRPPVDFQISQRADFLEALTGAQTTFRRPLVNSRDEPLCGGKRRGGRDAGDRPWSRELARLHVIFYDSTLCHVATVLKVGVLQIVLAMLEAGGGSLAPILDDPLRAVVAWSHDPTLRRRARLAAGKRVTAVEHQLLVFEEARRFVEAGGCDGIVPRAHDVIALWGETLRRLERRDFDWLSGRLDWVLKLSLLEGTMTARSGLDWQSAQTKHLDHVYSSLDPAEGLYWSCEAGGIVERLVEEARIEHFVCQPPADTRAHARAMLLRSLEADTVAAVDWDRVRVREHRGRRASRSFELPDPLDFSRVDTASAPAPITTQRRR